jgi:hypothetical protein
MKRYLSHANAFPRGAKAEKRSEHELEDQKGRRFWEQGSWEARLLLIWRMLNTFLP